MTRPRYAITDADRWAASRWLRGQLDDYSLDVPLDARDALTEALRDSVALNDWCEQHLNRQQWQQMQAAIRAARRRTKHAIGKPRGITLTPQAHLILSTVAARDSVTLSQVIERYLADEYTAALRQLYPD